MKLFKDDSGIAMITAIIVTLVVTSMAAAGFALSAHNVDQSAGDRRRIDAIHAAEAGIDAFLQYLSTDPTTATACSLPTGTLTATPPATYNVSATYYTGTNAGTVMTCSSGLLSGATPPGAVLIQSVGTSAGVSRKMEAWYGLVANSTHTPAFTGAVYSYKNATFSGGAAQFSSNSHQGNLFSETGDINLSGSSLIDGAIEARTGKITLSGSAQGLGNVTSYDTLTTSGGVIIWGDGRSSHTDVSNGAVIKGVEYYCTSKSGVGLTSPFTKQDCNPNLPVDQGGFPYFSYANFLTFADDGSLYTPQPTFTDCTAAHDYIMTGPTGYNVVYINANCTLNFSKETIPVNGNLAIVSAGSLNLSGGSYFSPSGPNTGFHLRLEFNINSTAPACTSNGITFSGGSTTGSGVVAELRTPCYADFSGGSFAGTGSVLAGNVNFSGGSSISALDSGDPSKTTLGSGFIEKFQYRREVI